MSAQVHTITPPTSVGERVLADRLNSTLNPTSHLWYNYLPPQGNEIDIILADPELGTFCIEVKAVPIDLINEYSLDRCIIRDREGTRNPVMQAYWGMYKLKQRLKDALGDEKLPWFIPTAAFPKITREEFVQKFAPVQNQNIFIRDHIEGLLFADDFDTADTLNERLRMIQERPPAGGGKNQKTAPKAIANLVQAIGLSTSVPETNSPQFEVVPGKPKKDSIRKFAKPASRGSVAIKGLPGSGKTQALLDIAISHAVEGRHALFVCFNKVLATKFRTDLDRIDVEKQAHDRILIADLYDLKKTLRDDKGLAISLRNYFDTVCVDEAQDLQMQEVDLLTFIDDIVSDDAEWFFAVGRDQELYGTAPARVSTTLADPSRVHELRRPSNTHTNSYRESNFAQIAFDYRFDANATERAGKELYKRVREIPDFSPHTLKHASQQLQISEIDPANRVQEYKSLIEGELKTLKEMGADFDLTILTASTRSGEIESVKAALNELGVKYLDQVATENRRKRLPAQHVRIVTVHSSRGLQATRVLLVGIHELTGLGSEERTNSAGYIALSRAMNGTHLVKVRGKDPSRFQEFVEGTNEAYERQF